MEKGHELRSGAPAKTPLLRFHSLKTKSENVRLVRVELSCSFLQEMAGEKIQGRQTLCSSSFF